MLLLLLLLLLLTMQLLLLPVEVIGVIFLLVSFPPSFPPSSLFRGCNVPLSIPVMASITEYGLFSHTTTSRASPPSLPPSLPHSGVSWAAKPLIQRATTWGCISLIPSRRWACL